MIPRQRYSSKSQVLTPDSDDNHVIDDVDVNVDEVEVPSQKPHFLDYDSVPPPDFEESFERVLSFGRNTKQKTAANTKGSNHNLADGEQLKMDKKYERDGEISDYELAASGYTKKEFTQDDNTLHFIIGNERGTTRKCFVKPKHFLDENPIPPDYMLEHEMREHHSLDRNFERQHERRTDSPSAALNVRKSSLDRGSSNSRSSRERIKEPSYTLSRFLDNDSHISTASELPQQRVPKGAAWTQSFDSRYSHIELPAPSETDNFGPKVENVFSVLAMIGSGETLDISKRLLELSRTPETCHALRRSGCIPLLVQMIHSENEDKVRKWATMALHNIVHSHPDEKVGRREAKVLRLLDQILLYCSFLKTLLQSGGEAIADDSDRHPLAAISSLMKVSFDEEHRHAMCELGALQTIPSLVHLDHAVHGPKPEDQCCNSLRRYALMALTNLTFGDEKNKALLCSQKLFMEALVSQLDCAPDDLLQVTASVLRNLSWRADNNMKAVLNEIGTVTALARAAMKNKNENTLKAILSALWNLSAHCSTNKAEFCAVDGALAFLVDMLTYEGPSKTLKIIENAGGILRNVSSHIAVREHYRQILRERNCLSILLQQLKSESLTVVSNSCGTLWNLSARCPVDQKFLWDNGAVPMLRSLIHSKHTMIAEGSSSALKNLLNFRPSVQNQNQIDPVARSMGLKKLPTLTARKQKTLEQELGEKEHAETCDNLDIGPSTSKDRTNIDLVMQSQRRYPLSNASVATTLRLTRSAMLTKSESRDSIFSAKSDSVYENVMRSHSASDTNRKSQKIPFPACHMPRKAFALESDSEPIEEQPIDYSVKYNENSSKSGKTATHNNVPSASGTENNFTTYQETDLDQPTDFSLRYAENQIESDVDISPPNASVPRSPPATDISSASKHVKQVNNGNEILLILEDSVKCYQTEDTPYVISNAASVTDLRHNKHDHPVKTTENAATGRKYQRTVQQNSNAAYVSGTFTPEKPINYCEEGTPGYFSRYESLSSLDESPSQSGNQKTNDTNNKKSTDLRDSDETKATIATATNVAETSTVNELSPVLPDLSKPSSEMQTGNMSVNSAQETPLMFSRHSSMDSLVEEDVGPCDDKSSVVSDFSRLASGIISPSEIPDSPTQSMPQSPRRNSSSGQVTNFPMGISPITPRSSSVRGGTESKRPLRSVFEDGINMFHVENTPAQFSCATSLSNLSIIDDDSTSPVDGTGGQLPKRAASGNNSAISANENLSTQANVISEGEEEEFVPNGDDALLANCINMGMKRAGVIGVPLVKVTVRKSPIAPGDIQLASDEPKQYFTEDTPAQLSQVGSNTNLSAISICSSNNELKEEHIFKVSQEGSNANRHSLALSDDVSSNASENGHSFDILQQCIQDGMKKPNVRNVKDKIDPISMMKRGGDILPPFLPVSDEMNKYIVEDSPCSFSVMSALSNLTVGSSLVGPSVQLHETTVNNNGNKPLNGNSLMENAQQPLQQEDVRKGQQWQDDSLSSLSIDSEDDTNLLSQAIAAGCNRPKSNLGFSSTSTNKGLTSLSASQPIPINAATSASSLTSAATSRKYQRQQQKSKQNGNGNGNDSFSSVDSSDSNENQSKSLFELCVLTGMHKTRSTNKSRREHLLGSRSQAGDGASTQSNPNLKQFDSLPMRLPPQKQSISNRHLRERKDEKLLLECISTGMSKKTGVPLALGNENINTQVKAQEIHFAAGVVPKNVQATSAAVSEKYLQFADITSPSALSTAAPDVEMNNGTTPINDNMNKNHTNTNHTNTNRDDIINDQRSLEIIADEGNLQSLGTVPETTNDFGCKDELSNSLSIENTTSDESNESFIIETTVSLENNQSQNQVIITADKHKDPDLMLKSVERLTLEFVSSAEQLRTNASNSNDSNETNRRLGSISVGGSNNTWNEDTCPNDISFPSISMSAPVVASLNDDEEDDDDDEDEENDDEQATDADHKELHDFAEITPTNEELPIPSLGIICDETDMYPNTQPNSLETETETETLINDQTTSESYYSNVNVEVTSSNGINFKLGGEVQSAAAAPSRHIFYNNSTMTNSAIIAIEARALAKNLEENDDSDFTYSINSLDLENVRPPSGMDSLNISGYYQDLTSGVPLSSTQPNSLQRNFMPMSPQLSSKSPKFPRKLLPAGLVARRALGQYLSGSAESVNSSCNLLDNIKPPSLMDELLDSMISVASIQSELADCESLATTVSISNYETAAGGANDMDDNTVTLQSCCDIIPQDEEDSMNSGTPLPSDGDYSSADTTPKKSPGSPHGVKRTLTPKQKRKLAKDRYKTYTIAATALTEEQRRKLAVAQQDETLQIEVEEVPTETVSIPTGGSRRRGSHDRYKTQTIVYPIQMIDDVAPCSFSSTDDCVSDDISSIKAMMKRFNFITAPINGLPKPTEYDYNSMELDQNSETESCHEQSERLESGTPDLKYDEASTDDNSCDTKVAAGPRIVAKPNEADFVSEVDKEAKAIRGRKKPAYVSPYSIQYQRNSNNSTTRIARSKVLTPITTALGKRGTGTGLPSSSKVAQKRNSNHEVPDKQPLERQGTFVKDEPTLTTAPVPVVDETSTQSSPTHRTSKLPTKRPTGSPKAIGATAARKVPIASSASSSGAPNMRKIPTAAAPQRSNSNATLRVTSNAARIAVLSTRVSATTPPSRSNSNLNSAAAAQAAQGTAAKINQAQSRIASIWKRVDDAKSKQQPTFRSSGSAVALKAPQIKSSIGNIASKQKLVRSPSADSTSVAASTRKPFASKVAQQRYISNVSGISRRETLIARK